MDLIWLVPALPLLGFVILLVAGPRLGDPKAGWVATGAVAASFAVAVSLFVDLQAMPEDDRQVIQTLYTWMPSGTFEVSVGFLLDPLSSIMILFITGIGALIHLYSIGYMKGDPKFSKFFLYLNLFLASMLVLVLGDNLLLTFLGWEGVGVCSYLLISFWHTEPANATAGKKAFVTNRIGDAGFMLGTFLVFVTFGSINYADLRPAATGIAAVTATAIALLFFVGAMGKSAQIPLFTWLPDAMAGPTPVSALIHAATMVTAGVYLITRLNPIMAQAGWANDVIAWTGGITALVAATIAVAQTDIKKVLAYSTVSQLGYMFMAVGTQTYIAGVFHMITHAFFKALLFLGAGAVIYSMAHEQDMRRYGNLRKYLPVTFVTFFIGWLAIAGVPPLSGFWSKDEILAGVFNYGAAGPALWTVGVLTALLTAFYMTRQLIMTFYGPEQWREVAPVPAAVASGAGVGDTAPEDEAESPTAQLGEGATHAHHDDGHTGHGDHHLTPDHEPREAPWTMLTPLVVLAFMAAVAGLMNLPFTDELKRLEHWLYPMIVFENPLPEGATLVGLAAVAIVVAVVGIWFAFFVYLKRRLDPARIELPILADGWKIDSTYAAIVGGPGTAAFQAIADADGRVVDGAVNGVGRGSLSVGERLRKLQNGLVRTYALGISVGTVALLIFIVTRMSL